MDMDDAAKVSCMEIATQTTARAKDLLHEAQVLTQQLTKLQQQAMEIPGDGTARINEYIVEMLHLNN